MFISGSDCYYDDKNGRYYTGRTSVGYNNANRTCIPWTDVTVHRDFPFPDGSRSAAGHYCRNVYYGDRPCNTCDRPWCFYNYNDNWVNCNVTHCRTYSKTLQLYQYTSCVKYVPTQKESLLCKKQLLLLLK